MPLSGHQALSFSKESGYQLLPIRAEHAGAEEDPPT